MSSIADVQDLGAEGLLGIADELDEQEARDRLALATRYLANWYRATKGTDNQAVWWQKIDTERARVEAAYSAAVASNSGGFLSSQAKVAYDYASAGWAPLWRELELSADTLAEPSLLDKAANIAEAPLAFLPTFMEGISKALAKALGNTVRPLVPWVVGGALVAGVYVFRKPIGIALGKVSA